MFRLKATLKTTRRDRTGSSTPSTRTGRDDEKPIGVSAACRFRLNGRRMRLVEPFERLDIIVAPDRLLVGLEYVRVSTAGQTAENQILEIMAAGFAVEPHRVVSETVSGSEAIARRAGFSRLLDRMERGDVLVVTRLDRLGRDAMDVSATVALLAGIGVRVHCLALGGVDLTSSAGRMTMGVINAVAQFERDLLVERTQSGLARARAQGKRLGRPHALDPTARAAVLEGLARGESLSSLARRHGTSRQTVMRLRDAVQAKIGDAQCKEVATRKNKDAG